MSELVPSSLFSLFRNSKRLLATAQLRQPGGKVVERDGEIGRERLGPRPRQLAVEPGRLLRARQRLLATAQLRQPVGKGVERHGEIGRERLGPRARQLA